MTDQKASIEDKLDLMRKDGVNAVVKLEQINQKLDRKADTFMHYVADVPYSWAILLGLGIMIFILGHLSAGS